MTINGFYLHCQTCKDNLLVLQDGVFDAQISPVDSAMHVNDRAQDIRKLSWPV